MLFSRRAYARTLLVVLLAATCGRAASDSCYLEDLRTGPRSFVLPDYCHYLIGISTINDERAVALAERLPGKTRQDNTHHPSFRTLAAACG